jgi:hypothetical protein
VIRLLRAHRPAEGSAMPFDPPDFFEQAPLKVTLSTE